MDIAFFCRTAGWTYGEYISQPVWFIERLKMMREAEAEFNNLKNKN